MPGGRRNPPIEKLVRAGVGSVVDFDGSAYLDEIAAHIMDRLGEDAVNRILAKTGQGTVEEVVLTYLDERTGAKP